ncbi:LAQU0S27e00364g1_1 [Lachancea quebecensis]|uniref:LAQU0S27e00364g1_1 n=1 Tax=Lachancea quebecensis TaxID=1654605 RepID=A0A0P1L019_9SACH|nr:LAQU0S27e00364g1_1 [Lachancea quebecensis]
MSFSTPQSFNGANNRANRTSSVYEVTPTKPLSLSKSPYEEQLRSEPNYFHRSSTSMATSNSNASFTTANSHEKLLNEYGLSTNFDFQDGGSQVSESTSEQTPIVAPTTMFDNPTPLINNFEESAENEPQSPDSFTFVERFSENQSSQRPTTGLGISRANESGQERSAMSSSYSSSALERNAELKRLSILEPTISPAQSFQKSPKKLERKSIHEAYTKQPFHLPFNDGNTTIDLDNTINTKEENRTFQDSTLSHDYTYENDLPQNSFEDHAVERKHTFKRSSELDLDSTSLAYLFIIAIHSFNSQSLKNEEDIAICLSFEKNDVAFVHTVDDSGWGEVTLVRNQKRGWVPFNYFSDTVKSPQDLKEGQDPNLDSRRPLAKLFSSSAQFLLHPQDHPLPAGPGMTFSLEYINSIRDGVKFLLQTTDCVSRSNELVQNRPIVKKARKLLLADWYNLMIKADSYKYTTMSKKIDTLKNLVFQVLRRGYAFYNTWNFEKQTFIKEKEFGLIEPLDKVPASPYNYHKNTQVEKLKRVNAVSQGFAMLPEAPFAVARLNEVHDLLFSYIGLILGRLDMVEHNPAGCEVLESVIHQVIVLLRELLYISKCCSSIIQSRFKGTPRHETTLDQSLDPLLSLVSELVSCIKIFVTQTVEESLDTVDFSSGTVSIKDEDYLYTEEGKQLITITSRMTGLIANSIQGCHRYLNLVGDFCLGEERSYPDFESAKITPEEFVRKCSIGLTKKFSKTSPNKSVSAQTLEQGIRHPYFKKIYRYSTIRSGDNAMSLSTYGSQFLQDIVPDNTPLFENTLFDKYRIEEDGASTDLQKEAINNREKMQEEIQFDDGRKLIGASQRALVFLLTDELNQPGDFLVSTFLLNFRSFSSTIELIDALITRFDITDKSSKFERGLNNGQYSSRSSRLRNRRRLVCRIFQAWMESYWDYQGNYGTLATVANFFNEGVSVHLPLEARNLLEIAARVADKWMASRKENVHFSSQIVQQPISVPSRSSMISIETSSSSSKRSTIISVDENIMESYELTKLPSAHASSISIPLPPLNVGTSSLLSKRNLNDMEKILKQYHSITGNTIQVLSSNELRDNDLLENMIQKWSVLVNSPGAFNNSPSLIHNDLNLVELNPLEVAKQLSLIESTLFLAVRPTELLNQNFIPKKRHLAASPDVERIVDFTNLLSNYIIESIVVPKIALKSRVSRLTTWLNIALSALYFRNFNTVATIMTALQSHILSRLSTLWDNMSEKYLDLYHYLSKIVHPNKNYNVYRTKLHKLATGFSPTENSFGKSQVATVPFFALFLQDLTFIHEGINDFRDPSSFRPNRLINIDKYFRITKIVSLMQFFQIGYDTDEKPNFLGSKRDSLFNFTGNTNVDTTRIKPVPVLQEFILYEFWRVNTLYAVDADRGYKMSLALAPRSDL